MEADSVAKIYIKQHRKSQLAGFVFAFFLGWFGLFYVGFTEGILFFLVLAALGLIYLVWSLWSLLPPQPMSSFLSSVEDWLDSGEAIPDFLSAISLMPEYISWNTLLFLILLNWTACIALSAFLISKYNKEVMAFAELILQPQKLSQPQAESQSRGGSESDGSGGSGGGGD